MTRARRLRLVAERRRCHARLNANGLIVEHAAALNIDELAGADDERLGVGAESKAGRRCCKDQTHRRIDRRRRTT